MHMVDEQVAQPIFERYGLDDLPRLSDPGRRLYEAVGLERGTFAQLFGWSVWSRFFGGAWRYGVGWLEGDGLQMPGAILVSGGQVLRAYRSRDVADTPDFLGIARRSPKNAA